MNKNLTYLFLLLSCTVGYAQQQERIEVRIPIHRKLYGKHPPHRRAHHPKLYKYYANIGSVNANTGAIGKIMGTTLGAEYERFLDHEGYYSISIPLMVYTGTQMESALYDQDTRVHISGVCILPGFRYHPNGNRRCADLSFGGAVAVGTYKRYDIHYTRGWSPTETAYNTNFAALLLQANATYHTNSSFIFGLQLSAGPMLAPAIAKGAYVQFGVKFGGGF